MLFFIIHEYGALFQPSFVFVSHSTWTIVAHSVQWSVRTLIIFPRQPRTKGNTPGGGCGGGGGELRNSLPGCVC